MIYKNKKFNNKNKYKFEFSIKNLFKQIKKYAEILFYN